MPASPSVWAALGYLIVASPILFHADRVRDRTVDGHGRGHHQFVLFPIVSVIGRTLLLGEEVTSSLLQERHSSSPASTSVRSPSTGRGPTHSCGSDRVPRMGRCGRALVAAEPEPTSNGTAADLGPSVPDALPHGRLRDLLRGGLPGALVTEPPGATWKLFMIAASVFYAWWDAVRPPPDRDRCDRADGRGGRPRAPLVRDLLVNAAAVGLLLLPSPSSSTTGSSR